jgi:hypothetical protein
MFLLRPAAASGLRAAGRRASAQSAAVSTERNLQAVLAAPIARLKRDRSKTSDQLCTRMPTAEVGIAGKVRGINDHWRADTSELRKKAGRRWQAVDPVHHGDRNIPATYEELLAETMPASIETDEEYERIHAASARCSAKAALRRRKKD